MAFMKQAKTEDEIKKMTVKQVKDSYNILATDYNHLIDLDYLYCHCCGTFQSKKNFYSSKTNASGYFHMCKKCVMKAATDYNKKTGIYTDNREKTINVLRMMDKPFDDSLYTRLQQAVKADVGERSIETVWQRMITVLSSLPQYTDKTFADSDFGMHVEENALENDEEIKELIKAGRKRFGSYPSEELYFLEKEYEDWVTRYPCDNKAQEELFKRVCFKQLEIDRATKQGRDTKDLDKSFQDLLGSLGVKPSQSSGDSLTSQLSFDQLIEKWEEEKPIPEPEGEFKDVDHIGMLIDVFFRGHMAKMMGIKTAFSSLYEKYMSKYTVTKPQYEDGMDTESLFNKIFGEEIDRELNDS